ncbi:MAG: DUF4294 domain-containing protein [Paludibacteraceae bacterium]|nr:DUF4294 domain-containing protein [Paludibacteraceae bacterium]
MNNTRTGTWHRRLAMLTLLAAVVLPLQGQIPFRQRSEMRPDDAAKPAVMATKLNPVSQFDKDQMRRAASEHYTFATIIDGDTVPLYYLRDVSVYMSGMLLTPKEIKNNAKLIRNVRLMLPYAREAKRRLDVLEVEIAALPKKDRKAAIKKAEQKLKDDYKDELSKRTFSQGLVLIKLIDRETSRTAYSLVGELRGSFRAGMYQALARLFGYNLKTKYDPDHDKKDELMERIVKSIERGQL